MKNISIIGLTLISVLFASHAMAAEFDPVERANAAEMGLNEVRKAHFDDVLAGDLALIEGKTKVYIAELDMDEVEIGKPDFRGYKRNNWELNEKDVAGFKKLYRNALTAKVEKLGDYEVVTAPSANTININAELVALDPIAPKDTTANRGIGEKYYTEGSGDVTIAFEVNVDGNVVLKAIDENAAGTFWKKNDRFTNKHNVKSLFNKWSGKLVKQLNLS